ncbi:lysM domain-containing GPI-anchored protein 2 [Impatiens glandulifera]|uniref:lysM domain-containing GPI-anchored protein 2 n=1 Tax=Impatiens glandulifera TaxID=253017 RepID=UPI001FB08FBA|nr:lysM domain-containing GPI-anchored protein 2 [Impatiens glandulifera]
MFFILNGKPRVMTLLLFIMSVMMIMTSSEARFTCNSPARTNCSALIDYISINSTTLSEIQTLFGVKHLRDLLGANALSQNTLKTQIVNANQKIRIPFTCSCSNGTGVSNGRPVYTVVAGDGLDSIARNKFAGLVTYQEIAAANSISDPNLIEVGQNFTIPLPCSCDDVDGKKVVHYGLVVESGSSVEGIAQKYGVSSGADTLLRLNKLASPNDLKAGAVLDVPLPACSSNIGNNSIDYPLLVSNATYVFTASNCVKCSCDAANNNWTLNCEPSSSDSNQICPSRQCSDSSFIGNSTTSNCNRQSCVYSGYNSSAIFTTVLSERACPGSSGHSLKMMTGFQDWFWKVSVLILFICHLVQ